MAPCAPPPLLQEKYDDGERHRCACRSPRGREDEGEPGRDRGQPDRGVDNGPDQAAGDDCGQEAAQRHAGDARTADHGGLQPDG